MLFPVIDFEASSLNLYRSYPIQVGCAFEMGITEGTLIRPHKYWDDWDIRSEAIHGIPRERLFDEGVDVAVVAERLNEWCDGNIMYCDGGVYDVEWCNVLFRAADIKRTFQLGDIGDLLVDNNIDGEQYYIWKTMAEKSLKLKAHDAVNDALIIQRAIQRITG